MTAVRINIHPPSWWIFIDILSDCGSFAHAEISIAAIG